MSDLRPGRTNSLTDVPGVRVGHSMRRGEGWLTGTTVILPSDAGAVAGVDVRGGGPGTRETDLLDPRNAIERVHAIVLSGGSAFGLATVDGVMDELAQAGIGFPVGAAGEVVPIVPAAVIFDLGRGGDFTKRPGADMGREAYLAARDGRGGVEQGGVGAGTGAQAGGLKGGVGSASAVLPTGETVAALAVVNPVGSAVDPVTGELYSVRFGLGDEFAGMAAPGEEEVAAARTAAAARADDGNGGRPGMATTVGVVATDATLTKAQCAKLSGIAHDGMARGLRPVHTMFDGDTVFSLATGERVAPDPRGFFALLEAAADSFTRAIGYAMLAAQSVSTPAGQWRSYRDAFPSVFALTAPDGANS
jgi:L-aminopeptidase/D-esterase-like protein